MNAFQKINQRRKSSPRPTSKLPHVHISSLISVGNYALVFHGQIMGHNVVVKMADYDRGDRLQHECKIYSRLETLQGKVIPICLGLYWTARFAILITSYCGSELQSFDALTSKQR
jgi:hypothetical protein